MFDEDDWHTALARFDELSTAPADPRTPRVENTVTRRRAAWAAMIRNGRFDEARARLGDFVAEGAMRVDRRSTVAAPDADGAGIVDSLQALYELGLVEMDADPIAVRGEFLALYRQIFRSSGGDEIVLLTLQENDATNRAVFVANYDEHDIAAAVAELDERHVAGEAAEDEYTIRRAGDFVRSMAAKEGSATLALMHPDVRWTDHRMLGFGALGFDGVRGVLEARAQEPFEDQSYFRDLVVCGSTMRGRFWSAAVDADGNAAALYDFHLVVRWVAGRIHDSDWYDLDDVDAAQARFDELAAQTGIPDVDNAVVRLLTRDTWRQEFDRSYESATELETNTAADIVIDDRRRGVSLGVLRGREEMHDNVRAQDELFGPTTFRPIAVRGDHLALLATRAVSATGFELVSLAIAETNTAGKFCAWTFFDENELQSALDLLEDRYAAGEGAKHGETLRLFRDVGRAYQKRDWSTVADLFAADASVTDHRAIGQPWSTRDDFITSSKAVVDLVPDVVHVVRQIEVRNRAILTDAEAFGTTQDGSRYAWSYRNVVTYSDGVITRMDLYDAEDDARARTRFDDLAAVSVSTSVPAEAVPMITNAGMRYLEAAREFSSTPNRNVDEFAARWLAEDVTRVDRRTGVSAPDVSGRHAYADVFRAMRDVFQTFTIDPIAVRGERLALVGTVGSSTDGFELPYLILVEVDGTGRARHLVHFDEGDLSTAMQEMEDRYVAGEV